jgi:hypothetical protein
MKKQPKMEALIRDLKALQGKHMFVLDKYSKRGETEYFLKLQFPDER